MRELASQSECFVPESFLILVVDDLAANLRVLRALLEPVGYALTFATSGRQALERVQLAKPDLILLDLMMPEMDGLEVCHVLKSRESYGDIPVMFLTASHERNHLLQSFERGAVDYITKPFDSAELLARVKTHLELKYLRDRFQRQTQRERLMGQIAQGMRRSLRLEEILQTVVTGVRCFLQADRVWVGQRQERTGSSGAQIQVLAEDLAGDWPFSMLGQAIADFDCFEILEPGVLSPAMQVIQDARTAPNLSQSHQDFLLTWHVQSELILPLFHQQSLWGFLVIHHCQDLRPWMPDEIQLLGQLTEQINIAIQHSALFQEINQLNTFLEEKVQQRTIQLQRAIDFDITLKRITDKVRDSLDETQILQTVVKELTQTLQVDRCNTGIYDSCFSHSTIRYEHGIDRCLIGTVVYELISYGDVGQVLQNGQWIQFCWLPQAVDYLPPNEQAAILACPIFDDQSVLGDLWLYRFNGDFFDADEVRLVQQVANQCAIALRQARLYQAAQVQVQELERLNGLKDDFLSTISHELRTPLASITMATKMLEIHLGKLDQKLDQKLGEMGDRQQMEKYLEILQNECHQEMQLVNDLLDLARLDAQMEPLVYEEIHVGDFIGYLLEPLTEKIKAKQVTLNLEIPADLPAIKTDTTLFKRVMEELLSNACKYTTTGQQIQIRARWQEPFLQLELSNSGVEIPERELQHLFDRFYRVPSPDPWRTGGTGLGLALVKKQVEHLGGTITAKNEQSQLTFTIQLPQVATIPIATE